MTATDTPRPGHRAGFFVALRFPLFKELPEAGTGTTDATPTRPPLSVRHLGLVNPSRFWLSAVALLSTTFQQFRRSAFAHQQTRSRPSLPTLQPVALLSPTCRAFTDPKPLAFFAY
jgi:hypothetical protein